MVYQNSFIAPTNHLDEKMRARFRGRVEYALRNAGSDNQPPKNQKSRNTKKQAPVSEETHTSPVLNFFGQAGDGYAPGRSIPTNKRSVKKSRVGEEAAVNNNRAGVNGNARHAGQVRQAPAAQQSNAQQMHGAAQQAPRTQQRPRVQYAPGVQQNPRVRQDARVQQNVRAQQRPRSAGSASVRGAKPVNYVSNMMGGVFAVAFKKAEPVRKLASNIFIRNKSIHKRKTMSREELKSRIAEVPGSRSASLRTDSDPSAGKTKLQRFLDSIRDNRKAEHRVKSSPFPFSYVAVLAVCAIMATVLLLGNSELGEYRRMIRKIEVQQTAEEEKADKLELEVEYREDITKIQSIAVGDMGMVSSDVAKTDFVSVPLEDSVAILRVDEEEKEGGFSALLSAIGEGIGKFSEYFN